eukprot:scaffold13266_cov72-Phaeocystis_antarctica.AAC.1
MNEIVYDKTHEQAGKNQVLVFEHSRKECGTRHPRHGARARDPWRLSAGGRRLARDPADRAAAALLPIQGLRQHHGARRGEAGAGAPRRARSHPRQGERRRAVVGQGQRAAAGLHLADQARRLLAALGHGLRHAVDGAADALHPRDRAQTRLGEADRQRAQHVHDG